MVSRSKRSWVFGSLGGIIALAGLNYCDHAEAKTVALQCVNNASGFRWSVNVDYDRHQVNSLPADISDTMISWYDPSDQGYYDLEAATGALTVRHASSVGGYFLYHSCHPS
jgi:hypothetical protein